MRKKAAGFFGSTEGLSANSRSAVNAAAKRFPLVPPWTVDEFCQWIEATYAYQVVLSPWQTAIGDQSMPGRCGVLWVTNDRRFVINYDATRSNRSQRQQIFHEFGHILCGHDGEQWRESMSDSPLAEGLDPKVVDRVMFRGIFDSVEEQDAEMLGTQLAVLSRQQPGDGRFDRIAATFLEPLRK